MTCEQTQPLLEAFADNDLGWGTAHRVRRHLAGCAGCASELAEVRRLDARVRVWREVPAPAGLGDRVADALESAPPASVSRRPLVVRRTAVGLAGLAAALVAFFWIIPGQPGRPTIAFADVEQAMQQVQTVSWTTEVQADNAQDHKPDGVKITYTNWLRRNPAAVAMTDFVYPISFSNIPIRNPIKTLLDGRGSFALYKDGCDVRPVLKVSAQQRVETQIKGLTQLQQASPSSIIRGQAQTTITGFQQRHVVVDGQGQFRFDRDVRTTWTAGDGHTTYRLIHVIDWADSVTHRITRIEVHVAEDTALPGAFKLLVMDHFLYNQPPPPGTFDWSPPPGAKVNRQ